MEIKKCAGKNVLLEDVKVKNRWDIIKYAKVEITV